MGVISSLQCFGGSLATTDCNFTVNSVPHALHKNDWDVSRTSVGSISGGTLANDPIEFFKKRKITTPIKNAIKYSIRLLNIYTQILLLQQQPMQLLHL